ncbi:AAA family ATPase [Williamsia muralis]|uniref:AAA family ATPase n=1 Tax=Williamsia marianensis TaxID=85044 RepID=A0ABU4EVU0_WILMA|nr:AAA family ATPase [Williamsia muralis]MDV7135375.1 AAA family ATPase [Williamsia muralis]
MTAPLFGPTPFVGQLSDDDRPVWISPRVEHVETVRRADVDVLAIPAPWSDWSTFDWESLRGREVHLVYERADDPVMRGTGDTPAALVGIREAVGHGSAGKKGSLVSIHQAARGGVDTNGKALFAPRATADEVQAAEVAKKVRELRIVDEARAVLAAEKATAAGVSEGIESAWLERDDLDRLPGLDPLIEGKLYRDSLAVLSGAPGAYKTFLVTDWACCIATGRAWMGAVAKRGRVLYLAGEGDKGLPKRIRAWELEHNGGEKAPVAVFPRPLPLHLPDDPVTKAFVESIVHREPDLVIVDTLNRFTPGMNENSAQDMGQFIGVLSQIKAATGACVIALHHNTRGTDTERGSTALRGAVDELFVLTGKDDKRLTVTLIEDRHKETASGGETLLQLTTVSTELGDSLAIKHIDPFSLEFAPEAPSNMPTAASTNIVKLAWNMYVHMRAHGGEGWTQADIRNLVQTSGLPLSQNNDRRRWSDTWGKARKQGYIVQTTGQRWELDTAKVESELGFDAAAEDHYRRHVAGLAETGGE